VLNPRIKAALVVLAASAGLGACTTFGSPYGGSGVSVGLGYGSPYGDYGYGSPYGYGYGSPYGYGYGGYPYFGWHDGFYYPGSGYWMYDPWGHQHPITREQNHFWSEQLRKWRDAAGVQATTEVKQDFSAFRTRAKSGATIPGVDLDAQAQVHAQGRADRRSVQQIDTVRRQAQVERMQQVRAQREAQAEARSERQQSMRQIIMEQREQRRSRRGGTSE
jgi:hypothetical protein